MEGNQGVSLSWNLEFLPAKDQNLGLNFKWWVPCCSIILRCVIFLALFSLTWFSFLEWEPWSIFVVLWKFFIIYFLKFVHGDLSFENCFRRFFLLKICSWRLKCRRFIPWKFVHEDLSLEYLFRRFIPLKSIIFFFFLGRVDSTTQVVKKGGGIFLAPISFVLFFLFAFPFSFFSLPPLLLFTHFTNLHFLPHYTISSLKNHFPKLLILLSFISLNIFLDLCVLDHFYHKPIFKTHLQTSIFLCIDNGIFLWTFLSHF